jgi:hypothetical protein
MTGGGKTQTLVIHIIPQGRDLVWRREQKGRWFVSVDNIWQALGEEKNESRHPEQKKKIHGQ